MFYKGVAIFQTLLMQVLGQFKRQQLYSPEVISTEAAVQLLLSRQTTSNLTLTCISWVSFVGVLPLTASVFSNIF